MDFGWTVEISIIAVNRHMGVTDVVGEHQKEKCNLTVIKNNDVSTADSVGDEYCVSYGLTQCFASVGKVACSVVQGHLLPQIPFYELEAVVMGRRAV